MSIKKSLIILIIFVLFGTINVYAEEKYGIVIDSNGNFTLKDSSNNLVDDSDVAKYEDGILTLGEDKYFNQIKTTKDIVITSNDKEVYIKELTTKEGNTYLDIDVTINNLKVLDSETAVFKVDVGGNFTVKDSEIYSRANFEIKGCISFINSTINNSAYIKSRNINNDEYAINITKSKINCGRQIHEDIGGVYIVDSSINTNDLFSNGNTYIEKSDIVGNYFTIQPKSKCKAMIKNSSIKVNKGTPGQFFVFLSSDNPVFDGGLIIEDSTNAVGEDSLIINDSTFILGNEEGTFSAYLYSRGDVVVNNSKISQVGRTSAYFQANNISLNDSELFASYLYINKSNSDNYIFNAKNSKITLYGNTSTVHAETTFENCELYFQKLMHFYENVNISNSKGEFSGITFVAKDLNISNSVLNISNETGFSSEYLPIIINNDLKISNSNVVIDNIKNDNKAACVQGNLILDDRIIPVDNEKTELKLIKLEDDSEEKSKCSTCYDANKPIHIFVYDSDDFSRYVKLATTRKAIFKVKDGTWLDGTKDDIEIDYLYGESLNIDELPEKVRELVNSKLGNWSIDLNNLDTTKDLEIEFKYDLRNQDTNNKQILNPETGDYLFSLLIILDITSFIFVFIRYKKRHDFLNN